MGKESVGTMYWLGTLTLYAFCASIMEHGEDLHLPALENANQDLADDRTGAIKRRLLS